MNPCRELKNIIPILYYVQSFNIHVLMDLIRDCYYNYPESHMTLFKLCDYTLAVGDPILELVHIGASILYTHGERFEASRWMEQQLRNYGYDRTGEITELEYTLIKEGECCAYAEPFGVHLDCIIPEEGFYNHLFRLKMGEKRRLLLCRKISGIKLLKKLCGNEYL